MKAETQREGEFQKEDRDPEYVCMGVGGKRGIDTQIEGDKDAKGASPGTQRKGGDTGSPIECRWRQRWETEARERQSERMETGARSRGC